MPITHLDMAIPQQTNTSPALSNTPNPDLSFSFTYTTLDAERSLFTGETYIISNVPHTTFAPGLYRVVDQRLLRIAPGPAPALGR